MIITVDGKILIVDGVFPRIMKLQDEFFEWVDNPSLYVAQIKGKKASAEIFTFVRRFSSQSPSFQFYSELERVAVLKLSSYEYWWKKQINDKTRNMVRRAQKSGVEIRLVPFDDCLINGIKAIYDETPVRQGKLFRHYQKSFEVLKREHGTFLSTSQFIGAYYDGQLIGFIKLVHDEGVSHLMQIISMVQHRDKAPTNALLAKAVEVCAEHNVPLLHYSGWSRRGLGDFKKHHGFEPLQVPRYFIPLNLVGKVALGLRLHRTLSERLPDAWLDVAAKLRSGWHLRFGDKKSSMTERV